MHFVCFAVRAVACRAARAIPGPAAHAGGTIPVVSGFNSPHSVVVDGSGNDPANSIMRF